MQLNYKFLFNEYLALDDGERILFLELVCKEDKFKVEFAQMGDSERKFHSPKLERGV